MAFSALASMLALGVPVFADVPRTIRSNFPTALKPHVGKQAVVQYVRNGRAGTMNGRIQEVAPHWIRITGIETVPLRVRHLVGASSIQFDKTVPFAGDDYITEVHIP